MASLSPQTAYDEQFRLRPHKPLTNEPRRVHREFSNDYGRPTTTYFCVSRAGAARPLQDLPSALKLKNPVKIVLLSKLDRNQAHIILEKWVVETRAQPRPGAATTRAAAALQPPCSQVITIARAPGMANTPCRIRSLAVLCDKSLTSSSFDNQAWRVSTAMDQRKDFVKWFISTFGGADAWAHAGYDVSKGTWSA
ncbi:hypothetical protein QBC46DRAFT_405864 [Diplogelasinospora grovesii]|uniref:Uncharacterized protein n=1 Tax=Diplogelasinospora grovesii TaxID=303347 RepID=A0AAN6S7M1_9PEZI|nr:hypothetical protein QBC46DRAFT_405864 [Diplogelasinospora grovesii]